MSHSSILPVYVSWGCSLHNGFTYTGWVIRCLRKGAAPRNELCAFYWKFSIMFLLGGVPISNRFGFMWSSRHTQHSHHFQKLPCLLSSRNDRLLIARSRALYVMMQHCTTVCSSMTTWHDFFNSTSSQRHSVATATLQRYYSINATKSNSRNSCSKQTNNSREIPRFW